MPKTSTDENKNWKAVVVINPEHPTMRRTFSMLADQAQMVRIGPCSASSVDEGAVVRINAKSDADYHGMVRWIEDWKQREKV